ncbi:hypothetical protein ABZ356_25420 [Micromonospora zamorensis]|uniref:hypothetical protein n=1 Tax=Micromonospora zamorensis TaxID=709883 RepID=UPI0033BD2B0F
MTPTTTRRPASRGRRTGLVLAVITALVGAAGVVLVGAPPASAASIDTNAYYVR